MTEAELLAGDDMVHGEAAYVLGPCEAHEHLIAGHYIKRAETGPTELGMGGVVIGQDPQAHAHDLHDKSNGSGSREIKHD